MGLMDLLYAVQQRNPSMSKEDKLALFTAIAKECGHKGSIVANEVQMTQNPLLNL